MKAIDLIFRETLTGGQSGTESHVPVFTDGAGNKYGDTFSEVRRNGRFEAYRYNGTGCRHMRNLMEAIFLNKVNKWTDVSAKALYLHRQSKKGKAVEGRKFIIGEVEKHLQAGAGKDKYPVTGAVREMPAPGGFILPYRVPATEGTKHPVNAEDMYIRRDGWEGSCNGTVAKVAQAVLEAGQTKEP